MNRPAVVYREGDATAHAVCEIGVYKVKGGFAWELTESMVVLL